MEGIAIPNSGRMGHAGSRKRILGRNLK